MECVGIGKGEIVGKGFCKTRNFFTNSRSLGISSKKNCVIANQKGLDAGSQPVANGSVDTKKETGQLATFQMLAL